MNVLALRDPQKTFPKIAGLKAAKLFFISPLRIHKIFYSVPKKKYDFVLITSANSYSKALASLNQSHWVFIGKKSADAFSNLNLKSKAVLRESSSKGVLRYFRNHSQRRLHPSIFFPRSAIADPRLVHELRKMGYSVCVRRAYRTEILNIERPLKLLLQKRAIEAVVFFSPSGLKSFRKSTRSRFFRSWSPRLIAFGPTTGKALRNGKR